MLKTTLSVLLIFNAIFSYSQSMKTLLKMKSDRDTLDIRYNNYLDERSWILSKKKKIDILKLPIEDSTKVTFISGIDSISFTVKVGEKYDFIISNSAKNFHTRVEGIKDNSKRDDSLANLNFQCLRTNLLSVSERNKNYPFNKAFQIGLISFIDPITDFTTNLPVKNGRLESDKIREQRILNNEQIDELTDILYNIGRTPVDNLPFSITSSPSCYEPRNGIIFIDSKEDIFEYIEICFGCRKSRLSSRKVRVGENCEQKYDILRNFFLNNELRFGTATDEK